MAETFEKSEGAAEKAASEALAAKVGAFVFRSYAFHPATGVLTLRYGYEKGPAFEERIVFPLPLEPLSKDRAQALDSAFRLVFLLAGVSYYKAFVPDTLLCPAFPLDAARAAFLDKVYLNGLGEFAVRNGLDLRGRIRFPVSRGASLASAKLDLPDRWLVPVGGGKDSIVTLETLRRGGVDVTLFAMGSADGLAQPIRDTIRVAGLPALGVTRMLSPNMKAVNESGGFNGHVPVTAILSAVAVATALLQGFRGVLLSNEHSADIPNFMQGSLAINHQYSKSLDFEADFADEVMRTVANLDYFSFLRPLSEAEIARRFAGLSAYHGVFRSCNRAFRQSGVARASHWCCDCPKCRFVFLALAPFLDKNTLIRIFGTDMLADSAQIDGFRALCGIGAEKPFECVGTVEESRLLALALARKKMWENDSVIMQLAKDLSGEDQNFEKAFAAIFKTRYANRLSPEFRTMLDAFEAA